HHHHRAIATALADQPFVGALHTVGEAQLQLLDTEQATAGNDFSGEDGGFLTHGQAPGMAGYHSAAFTTFRHRSPNQRNIRARQPPRGTLMQSLPWNQIDTVLLDMDGTLLDLHFDNHFW